jgi:ribonuclease HIII
MPWVVGIDEAGYGPNLGPLVQAAVAVKLPDADPAGWDTLKPHVRRAKEKADKRVLVDDSKLVHSG